MEFKEYVELQEAPTGVRIGKDSGDSYDPDKQSSISDKQPSGKKFNPKEHAKLINSLAPKFKQFFSGMARTTKRADPMINKLKLNQSSGSRSLAILYAKLLEDIMADGNGNPMSLKDGTSAKVFSNRLQTQLGEGKSMLYPILFFLGRDVLSGDTDAARKGSTNLLSALSRAVEDIGAEGETAYKAMGKFDQIYQQFPSKPKAWQKSHINDRVQELIGDAKDGNLSSDDIMYMSPDDYDSLYFPDVASGEGDDEGGDEKFTYLKKAMFDAIKDAEAKGEEPFEMGTETDKVVKELGQLAVDSNAPYMIDAIANAIMVGSKGSRAGITAEWLSGISDYNETLAKHIKSKVDKQAGDSYEPEKPTSSSGPGMNQDTLDSVQGGEGGTAMNGDDANTFKDALKSVPSSRGNKFSGIFDRLKGKTVTQDQYKDLSSFIDSLGRDGSGHSMKTNFPSGKAQLLLKNSLKVESATYEDFLNLFESRNT